MARHGGHGRGHGAGEPRCLRLGRGGGELLEVVPHEGADHKVLVCGADEVEVGREAGKTKISKGMTQNAKQKDLHSAVKIVYRATTRYAFRSDYVHLEGKSILYRLSR